MTKRYFALLLFASLFFSQHSNAQNQEDKAAFDLSKNLTIYHNILKELNLLYVDSLDNAKLIRKGINNMLSDLDPYTVYISEEDMADFKTQTTGEYGGIGALVGKQGDYIIISEVYKDFPADKAGLKAGDKLLRIEGKNAIGMDVKETTAIMKDRPNTSFKVTVERPYVKKNPIDMTIMREKIQLDCVPYDTLLNKTVGYLLFTNFTNKAEQRVKATVKKLKDAGATSLILDMRGNLGGLLDQAVKIINLFIRKNETVVATKGRISQWDRRYQTTKKSLDTEIPIVVLINSGSASASEIVAGTLQDLDRALIMGTHSFGKGLVQTTREVGYNSKLKVTTSKYYIPSGRCIQALDYAHRNEDGSVGHIPDSLITAFKTRKGRTVYDGGGIMPDVKVDRESYSSLTVQLLANYKLFDFANWYANTHKKGAMPFVINAAIYQNFVDFIDTADFNYESKSYHILKDLKKEIAQENLEENPNLLALEKELKPKLKADLQRHKKEIQNLLEYEINVRQFYQKGGYSQAIRKDKLVAKAIAILLDTKTYKEMLDGSLPADSSKREKQED